MKRYGHSKLTDILFARKFTQLYLSITSPSQHPGIVATTGFFKATGVSIPGWVVKPFVWAFGVAPDKGAHNTLWSATTDVGAGGVESGRYYEPVGMQVERSKHATDQHMADLLWEWTEKELAEHGARGWPAS